MTSAFEEGYEPAAPLLTGPVTGFFVLVAVLLLGMLVLFGWMLTRNVRLIRRADAQVASGRPPVGSVHPARPLPASALEQRLLELDDLHRRGVISEAERHEARQRVLTGG